MGGLHRFPYHANEVVAHSVEVRLIPELGTEGFQCPSRIVLAPEEAAIYKRPHSSSQRYEQACNGEGRDHDSQLYNVGKATLRVVGFFSSAAVVTIFDDPLAPLNTKVSPWPGRLFQWPRRTRSKYLPLLGRGCHSPRLFLMLSRVHGYPTQVFMRCLLEKAEDLNVFRSMIRERL